MRGTKAKMIQRFCQNKNQELRQKGVKKAVHKRLIKKMYNRTPRYRRAMFFMWINELWEEQK